MKREKLIFICVFIGWLGMVWSGSAYSLPGGEVGVIQGRVVDQNGQAVSNARVTAHHQQLGKKYTTTTDIKGYFQLKNLPVGTYDIYVSKRAYAGTVKKGLVLKKGGALTVNLSITAGVKKEVKQPVEMEEAVVADVGVVTRRPKLMFKGARTAARAEGYTPYNTEEYDRIYDNQFLASLSNPLSTFSIDVDTASYANVRRFIKMNRMPPKDAVRTEELINYFDYQYPQPQGKDPFSITTELSQCPWAHKHQLLHIGLQGRVLKQEKLPPSNLVFLIDVSGSMGSPNKLPLLKSAFKLLVNQLDDRDRVALAVYAGAAGLVLPPTTCDKKEAIISAIDRLSSGGSTAGGAGIRLAYKVAMENLLENGNNRIIVATDGDFNIGVSSTSELVRLVEEKREKGIFLTMLGFGMGNYKDSRMEQLADKGNGNYFYIDNILEAKKVFIHDMRGTLFTIAKDVKIQVEFNPAKVKAYRLIGYENRMLKKEDFKDDTKDAGELGAGHTVTALYEIVPAGSKEEIPGVDELKYQQTKVKDAALKSKEIVTVKLRYKAPKGSKSKLITRPVLSTSKGLSSTSNNFRFSAAVAQFAMLLRDSKFKGNSSYDQVLTMAKNAKGDDTYGYRAEFIRLVEMCQLFNQKKAIGERADRV